MHIRFFQNKVNGLFDLLITSHKNPVHKKIQPILLNFLVCTTQFQHDAIYLQESQRMSPQDQIYTFLIFEIFT